MLESLESRRLFAVSVTLDAGVLKVIGTDTADTLFVTESAGTFEVGIQDTMGYIPVASVPESMVTRVLLDGGDGDDFLVLQTSGAVGGDVLGGNGNDEIHLEDDATAISIGHGGNNNDLLVIFKGNGTEAHGDNGEDILVSLEGSNTTYLFGGNAMDSLTGSLLTVVDGGNGKDTITVS
jgi:hypothetical protein